MTRFTESTLVIGANFWNHDASIFCLDLKGQRAFGMSTERITRYKHDTLPPVCVVRELIREWQIDPSRIEKVVVATNLRSFFGYPVPRDLHDETVARRAADGVRYKRGPTSSAIDHAKAGRWKDLARMLAARASFRWGRFRPGRTHPEVPFEQMVAAEFQRLFPRAVVEVTSFDHHLTHAAGALVLSNMDDPLVLTIDGHGDGYFSKAFVMSDGALKEVSASPSSDARGTQARRDMLKFVPEEIVVETGIFDDMTLGHFYSIFTWLLGFEPVSDEGKLEALAAFAPPDQELLAALRGTVRLEHDAARLVVCRDEALALYYDIPRLRQYVERLGREVVAASMQRFLEDCVLELASCLLARYPRKSLVLTGGCTANVILNMRLFESACPSIFVAPAMADDGTTLGAAVLALQAMGHGEEAFSFLHDQPLPYFGNQHDRPSVTRALAAAAARVAFEACFDTWPERAATRLARGEVGALYQGRMEWGPRALGNRSILANPCLANTREYLNATVKRRPLFQPFCPAIMEEERERLFERSYPNGHMTCAFLMRREFWDSLPSAVHVDGTARAQFVLSTDNPGLHRTLAEFRRLTGFGVLLNTSFNLHGRTIVNTPEDAIEDFLDSKMDFLVMDGYLVTRRATNAVESRELSK